MLTELHGIRYTILCLCLAVLAVLPVFIISFTENIDPFSFSTAGLAQTYSQENNYYPYPYEIKNPIEWQSNANEVSVRAVPVFILVMLGQVTGLPLSTFLFVPLMGLIFSLLVFILAKKFVNSSLVALLFVLVMNCTFFPINVYFISVGLCLFLLFVILWLKFMDAKETKGAFVFLLFIIFIAMYYSYYTAEFLVFCLLFASLTFPWIIKKLFGAKIPNIKLIYLLTSFIVIFAYFDYQFYNYFAIASPNYFVDSLSSYFNYVLHFLQAGGSAVSDYRPQISNPIVIYSDLLQRVLIFLSLSVYLLYFAKNFRKGRFELSYKAIGFISLFFVGIMQILLYASLGYAQQIWALFLVSSLAAFFCLDFFRLKMTEQKKNLRSAFFAVILLLIVTTGVTYFTLRVVDPVNPNSFRLHSEMNPAVIWSVSHSDSGYIAADSRTAAQLFLETAKEDKTNTVYPYRLNSEVSNLYNLDTEVPNKMFGNRTLCFLMSYEFKTRSFLAGNQWSYCPPLGNALSYLDTYPSLNRIYDDGRGLVYRYDYSLNLQ